jgi:hypothetical protein
VMDPHFLRLEHDLAWQFADLRRLARAVPKSIVSRKC